MPQSYTPVLSQDALRRLWHGGQEGRLSAWEVAKALGLREASKELHDGTLNLPWVAQRLKKLEAAALQQLGSCSSMRRSTPTQTGSLASTRVPNEVQSLCSTLPSEGVWQNP